jgi:hypothetical protein
MSLAVFPASGTTGYPVTFTVTANNSETLLMSVSIDFTSDGTWDYVKRFDQSSITATFSHTYVNAGLFNVRVEVQDAYNAPTATTLAVKVTAPNNPPVRYELSGSTSITNGWTCYDSGQPAECDGCSRELPEGGVMQRSLGSFPHGTPVKVTQAFKQDRWTRGSQLFTYGCSYRVRLVAGTPGNEVTFAESLCGTRSSASVNDPTLLTCSATATGTVP